MAVKREWLPPCGLYCGVCGILIADRDDNIKFKEKLATVYNLPVEEIHCDGCLAEGDNVFKYCRVCPIKACAAEKGMDGCHLCEEFPCSHIDEFVMPVGRKVMLRAVPQRREWGDEKWAEEETKRYVCPSCGYALFRGAKRCRECREPVDLD